MKRTRLVKLGLAAPLCAAVLAAGVASSGNAAAAAPTGGSSLRSAADGPSLVAWVSTHHPCSIPVVLRARLRDAQGEGVRGVRVRFRLRLADKVVYRYARTDSRGLAKYLFHPRAATAPPEKRVRVAARAVYQGDTLRGHTWFTPTYL